MRRRNLLLPMAAVAGAALFFCFLVHLLLLRYERGDVYPGYSTLRADPLGTRAFYEALGSVGPYGVARGFQSLHRELEQGPGTLFYLGLDSDELFSFTKEEVAQLDTFVKNGGRVVITLGPESPGMSFSDETKKVTEKKKEAPSEPSGQDGKKPETAPVPPEPEPQAPPTEQEKHERDKLRREQEEAKDQARKDALSRTYHRSLAALWGFGWQLHKVEKKKDKDGNALDAGRDEEADKPEVLAQRSGEGNLEPTVPWKSALYFVRLEPEWQNLYDAKDKPVLVRRAWGKGEIILASDSYLVSNEALRNDRRPALLAFLAGPPGRLLFDETHLGTEEQEGIVSLAEKFRLEGYFYGMLAVAVLVLWRNSVPLVPPRSPGSHAVLGGTVSGKDSRNGFVNLLRRNIAVADILRTSFAEWKRAVTPGRRHLAGKVAAMESVLSAAESSRPDKIVQSYHQLREINAPSRAQGNYATKS